MLKQKEDMGDGQEYADAYKEACLGNHEGMSQDEVDAKIAEAKENWEDFQQDSHLCDMALERLGYSDENTENIEDSDPLPEEPIDPQSDDTEGDPLPTSGDPEGPYSEGRIMNDASKEQLDTRNDINKDFLDRNGSGDYSALDDYLSKYDNKPDYSEGRVMDDASKEQLDTRNDINKDFLDRNGSGDYSALDDYLSKYDSDNAGNQENNESSEQNAEENDHVNSAEENTENAEQSVDEGDQTEKKSTLKETLAEHSNPEANAENEEKIKETEAKLEEAESKLEESKIKEENAETPDERKEAADEREKQQENVVNFSDLLKQYYSGR